MHIRTRNDLIKWLEEHAPTPSIRRALQEGKVENLGGFNLPYPGWIIKVVSKFNTTWFVRIYILKQEIIVKVVNYILWKNWIGDTSNNKLYQGDNPELYEGLKNAETEE